MKPLAIAAVAILPLNTVHAQSSAEVPALETLTGELKTALSDAISFDPNAYAYANAFSVDVFAGYLAVNRSTFQYGGPLPFTYSWPNDYYPSAGNIGPVDVLYNAYTYAEQLGYPAYKAIAQIVYGMTALRATNVKGAISYVDSRNLKSSRPLAYQSQQEAYDMILSDLNEAIATLERVQPDVATLQAIEGDDLAQGEATAAYSGYNWQNWVKLANTIKLRLAMCLAKPDPTLAQQVATEALSGIGVLDDDFGATWVQGTTVHPVYSISSTKEGWAECRMGASIENAMKRLGHPLIGVFFTTNSGQIKDRSFGVTLLAEGADYVGIRQGVTMEPKSPGAGYYNFSEVNTPVKFIRQTWVCKEEVLFLKAEAALRWGIGGSAQQNYEDGIRAVFTRYGASGVDEYLARTETVKDDNGNEIDYVDYYVNSNSCPGRIEVGVAWNDGDSDETKLEKIITQKWISMFPNGGYEAWTDFRRTGYPRLLPVPEENRWTGTPSFPVELQIRRIPNIYSTDYDFSIKTHIGILDIYDEPRYVDITKKEGVSLSLSVDNPDIVSAELTCADETTCRLKVSPKGVVGDASILISSSSYNEYIHVRVYDKLRFSENEVALETNGSKSMYLYVQDSYSQNGVTTSLVQSDGSGNEVKTKYSISEVPAVSTDSTKYEITFTAGDKAEELIFKATAKDRTISVPIYVSYEDVYLSFNTIDPSNPNDNIENSKPLSIDIQSQANLEFNFYVNGSQAILQEILEKVRNVSSYKYEGTGYIMLGTPTVTSNVNGTYRVSVKVYSGGEAGDGIITLNVYGDELRTSVYIDDGKRYDRVYISFTRPKTYTIPPTEMTLTTSKLVLSDESTFTIRVYHDISPDNRARYIDWKITQGGDPVITPAGQQCSEDNLYTDFEYVVSGIPGKAVINFNVYNPQGELGGEYAEYLNQTITATVTVADKESFLVNSVTFNPDDIVTGAADVPLEAVMDPVVSSAAWPIGYSIIEGNDLATIEKITTETEGTTYSLDINRAGVIKVKAEAGPKNNRKSDILTVTAKLWFPLWAPLEITSDQEKMFIGDTYTIEKQLHANYTVDEDQYSWSSSAPGVISVDGSGNITARSEGTAVITVSITDDYGNTASDSKTIEVVPLDLNLNVSTLPDDYYVVVDGSSSNFWVDTVDGSITYYTFSLDNDILGRDGVYTVGTDFNGTVTFPYSMKEAICSITGGTITVSGGNVTFNLSVSYNSSITGKITGSKPILVL